MRTFTTLLLMGMCVLVMSSPIGPDVHQARSMTRRDRPSINRRDVKTPSGGSEPRKPGNRREPKRGGNKAIEEKPSSRRQPPTCGDIWSITLGEQSATHTRRCTKNCVQDDAAITFEVGTVAGGTSDWIIKTCTDPNMESRTSVRLGKRYFSKCACKIQHNEHIRLRDCPDGTVCERGPITVDGVQFTYCTRDPKDEGLWLNDFECEERRPQIRRGDVRRRGEKKRPKQDAAKRDRK